MNELLELNSKITLSVFPDEIMPVLKEFAGELFANDTGENEDNKCATIKIKQQVSILKIIWIRF